MKELLEECEDSGYEDFDAAIFNRIQTLVDDVETCDKIEELNEIKSKAQTIENDIDNILEGKGISSIGIDW